MTRCAKRSDSEPFGSRVLLLPLLVLALLAPGAATAQDDEEEARDVSLEEWNEEESERWERLGPFVGIGGLVMFPNERELHDGVRLEDGVGGGFNVRLGLRTAHWFALEVMYEQVASYDVSRGAEEDDAKGWFWSLNAKAYGLTDTPIQPYLLTGAGAISIQPRLISRRTGFGMRFAAGLDYHLTERLVAVVEGGYAMGIGTQVEDYQYGTLSFGLTFRY